MSDDKLEFFESGTDLNLDGVTVALVASRYNTALVNGLLQRTVDELVRLGIEPSDIMVERVPGAHEIPLVADILAFSGSFNAVIALGVIVAGETDHHSVIANALAKSLMDLSCRARLPVINGVLCVENTAQAEERVLGSHNRGVEFAATAIEMIRVHENIRAFDEAGLRRAGLIDDDTFDENN